MDVSPHKLPIMRNRLPVHALTSSWNLVHISGATKKLFGRYNKPKQENGYNCNTTIIIPLHVKSQKNSHLKPCSPKCLTGKNFHLLVPIPDMSSTGLTMMIDDKILGFRPHSPQTLWISTCNDIQPLVRSRSNENPVYIQINSYVWFANP